MIPQEAVAAILAQLLSFRHSQPGLGIPQTALGRCAKAPFLVTWACHESSMHSGRLRQSERADVVRFFEENKPAGANVRSSEPVERIDQGRRAAAARHP